MSREDPWGVRRHEEVREERPGPRAVREFFAGRGPMPAGFSELDMARHLSRTLTIKASDIVKHMNAGTPPDQWPESEPPRFTAHETPEQPPITRAALGR